MARLTVVAALIGRLHLGTTLIGYTTCCCGSACIDWLMAHSCSRFSVLLRWFWSFCWLGYWVRQSDDWEMNLCLWWFWLSWWSIRPHGKICGAAKIWRYELALGMCSVGGWPCFGCKDEELFIFINGFCIKMLINK